MNNSKTHILIKSLLISIIIILPIQVLQVFSKDHTYIEKNQNLPLEFSKYFNKKYTLLYVGYTGCTVVCMPRLNELSKLQKALEKNSINNLSYKFLDIRDIDKGTSNDFLSVFNESFEVLYLSYKLKKEFLKELGFFYNKSLSDSNEYEHTSYVYLIEKREKQIKLISIIMQYPFVNDDMISFLESRVKND